MVEGVDQRWEADLLLEKGQTLQGCETGPGRMDNIAAKWPCNGPISNKLPILIAHLRPRSQRGLGQPADDAINKS